MTYQNFFYTLAALRVANLASSSQPRATTLGTYRNFVRQYAQQLGDPSLGEASDEVVLGALVLLHKRSCLELRKFEPETWLWWDYSEIGDIWKFVNGSGFTMKLTPEGLELLSEMEAQLAPPHPVKQNAIGFHTS
jgi:hypothetical protein